MPTELHMRTPFRETYRHDVVYRCCDVGAFVPLAVACWYCGVGQASPHLGFSSAGTWRMTFSRREEDTTAWRNP